MPARPCAGARGGGEIGHQINAGAHARNGELIAWIEHAHKRERCRAQSTSRDGWTWMEGDEHQGARLHRHADAGIVSGHLGSPQLSRRICAIGHSDQPAWPHAVQILFHLRSPQRLPTFKAYPCPWAQQQDSLAPCWVNVFHLDRRPPELHMQSVPAPLNAAAGRPGPMPR